MIYIEMYGRLGNQLFRYAMARYLQLKFYPEEELCLNFTQINRMNKIDPTFYNAISDFNIADYTIYNKNGRVVFNETSLLQKMVAIPYYLGLRKFKPEDMNAMLAYEKKWIKKLNKNGIYWLRTGYLPLQKSLRKNKFVSGNFESPEYLEEIRDILLQEFTPKHKKLEKNREIYKLIRENNSICITVRRGDFESNNDISKLHSICDKVYFNNAINEMKHRVENPVFFLFSDDIDWAKKNIITGTETYYEDGTDPVWEKLRMMSSCKHFILSNSTFSWWCQWLSKSQNKIVISPKRWFNNDYVSPLIDSSWIKL